MGFIVFAVVVADAAAAVAVAVAALPYLVAVAALPVAVLPVDVAAADVVLQNEHKHFLAFFLF